MSWLYLPIGYVADKIEAIYPSNLLQHFANINNAPK